MSDKRAVQDEAAQARLITHLNELNPDPNSVASGVDETWEQKPGEFAAFGKMIASIDNARDTIDEKQVKIRRTTFRWLRTQCIAGPFERRRFSFFGQKIIRCSSLLKFSASVHEEAYLAKIHDGVQFPDALR